MNKIVLQRRGILGQKWGIRLDEKLMKGGDER